MINSNTINKVTKLSLPLFLLSPPHPFLKPLEMSLLCLFPDNNIARVILSASQAIRKQDGAIGLFYNGSAEVNSSLAGRSGSFGDNGRRHRWKIGPFKLVPRGLQTCAN